MKKTEIRRAVERKVDEKLQKAINDEAESLARQKVWEALHPPMKFDAPSAPGPMVSSEKQGRGNQLFSPSDPKLTGG